MLTENSLKKILVIDDDQDILIALETILVDAGYNVETYMDVELLQQLHAGNLPDLILLDMLLSGADGRDVARELKSRTETRHIPLLMISAHPSAEREAIAAGIDGFLAKPFEIDSLLEQIRYFLV